MTVPSRRRPQWPSTDHATPTDAFGVYIHIPFCAARCDYCAFATWSDRGHLIDTYLDALALDIERSVADGMPTATSVFVGGGTPTLVSAPRLAAIIASIPTRCDSPPTLTGPAGTVEVTVECNPDDVTVERLSHYLAAGANRVSIGVQSTQRHVLAELGRGHDAENVAAAVAAVRAAGMPTFGLDLIYGARGESVEHWRATLDDVLALDPPHVSAYALTPEAGTPLGGDPRRHPDDDDQANKYELADELFERHGLVNYEISNWARVGHECQHNLLYWSQGDYVGFGSAAHSHLAGHRWWNVRTPQRYIDAVQNGTDTYAAGEVLDANTRRRERLELALRTRTGVPAASLAGSRWRHLLEPVGANRLALTRSGRLLANEVSLDLMDPVEGP